MHDTRSSRELKRTLLPGIIIATIGTVIAIVGCALAFISASTGLATETETIFGMTFSGGRTVAGMLLILAFVLVFLPLIGNYAKPTPGVTKRAGLGSIIGAVVGIVTVLLIMYVFPQQSGESVAETLNQLRSMGIDAGYSVGAYVTIAGFVIGGIGGLLFFLKAGPFDRAMLTEQAAAVQNAPMVPGQGFGPGGPMGPGGQQPPHAPQQYGGPIAPGGQQPPHAPQQYGGPIAPGGQQPPHAPQQYGGPIAPGGQQPGTSAQPPAQGGEAGGTAVPPPGPPSPDHPHGTEPRWRPSPPQSPEQ